MAFIFILKYLQLFMKISKDNIFSHIILVIIYFILILNLNNEIKKTKKFKLVNYLSQKSLLLSELKLYKFNNSKLNNTLVILIIKAKNLFIVFFL